MKLEKLGGLFLSQASFRKDASMKFLVSDKTGTQSIPISLLYEWENILLINDVLSTLQS